MSRPIRTHNKRRKRAHAIQVQVAAFEFHEQHAARLVRAGRWDKLRNTGWIRRMKKLQRAAVRRYRADGGLVAVSAPGGLV